MKIVTTTSNQSSFMEKVKRWEESLTSEQRIEIKYAGLEIKKAYNVFKKYDINKLTLKDISSVARVAAMGIS